MAAIIDRTLWLYTYLIDEVADKRADGWFLVRTPFPLLTIIFAYLYFIYNLGPKFMAKREPFKLHRVMQLYDIVQIVMNAYLFYQSIALGWFTTFRWLCEPVDWSYTPRALKTVESVYIYYLLKLIDLIDTVFFVLRKKENQVSFLHVYHHVGMTIASWVCIKWLPGGHSTFIGCMNTFVHVIMYSHYLVSSMKIGKLWWKKYVTQLQILQFFLIFCQFTAMVFVKDCPYPKWTAALLIPQNLFVALMFCDFYYKAYVKKNPDKTAEQNATTINGKTKVH